MRYTFLTIENEETMRVPGEIVETYTNQPYSRDQFTALVKLDSETESGDGEDDSERVIDYDEVDGIGDSTAKNLVVSGYESYSDVREASIEELAEVDGIGPATAESLKEYVE